MQENNFMHADFVDTVFTWIKKNVFGIYNKYTHLRDGNEKDIDKMFIASLYNNVRKCFSFETNYI